MAGRTDGRKILHANEFFVSATLLRVVLIVSGFLFVISLWGFYTSIRPPKIISSLTPRDLKMNHEDVSFRTADGLLLRGWHIPSAKTTDKTVILLHGFPADKGNILPALAFLHGDFNLLLFDFRYLGQSEGSYSTAGAKEVEDLLAAVQFLKTRGVKEVGVWGFSMGGAVALMAIEKAPEIKAVIAESSYANLAHMAVWVLIFGVMTMAGAADGMHKGDSLPFWEQACAGDKPRACERLLRIEASYCGDNAGWACNELGRHHIEGRIVQSDPERAIAYFSRACEGRFQAGCVNVLDFSHLSRANPRPIDLRLLLREGGPNLLEMPEPELYQRACKHGWSFACQRAAN